MLIKHLSPELRELAVKNTLNPECSHHALKEYTTDAFILNMNIDNAFVFYLSPEGGDFWWHVLESGTAPENHPLHSKESSE